MSTEATKLGWHTVIRLARVDDDAARAAVAAREAEREAALADNDAHDAELLRGLQLMSLAGPGVDEIGCEPSGDKTEQLADKLLSIDSESAERVLLDVANRKKKTLRAALNVIYFPPSAPPSLPPTGPPPSSSASRLPTVRNAHAGPLAISL